MLTSELIRRGARQFSDRTAVICGDRRMTYREVDELSSRIANVLLTYVRPGDCVGLLVGNQPETIALEFSTVKARVSRMPLNPRLSAAEHEHMLRETGTTLMVYGPGLEAHVEALASAIGGDLRALSLGPNPRGDGDLMELVGRASPAAPDLPARPDDVVLTIYTSGTTGKLKAAQHTQSSYAAICANILANLVAVERDDVMLHAAPLVHASGTFNMPVWVRGGTAAILPGFDPEGFLDAIERWRPTLTNLVPTMLAILLSLPGVERRDASSLRAVVYGASPMPRPTLARAKELWGPKFIQYYGQTEAPLCISVLRREDHEGPGHEERMLSCGQPAVDAEVRVVDEEGREVAAGELGEVAVRAPFQMTGYFRAPELTASVTLPDGAIRTRDVGRFDERGYLYLVDRTSDMIVTGGYNVYPREVEDALAGHPAVAEAAVVGAPDDRWVEAVTAFVALRPGTAATEAELQDHVRRHLAGYKVPKTVRFQEQLPKSAVGKILRRALRDPLWAGHDRPI